MASRESEIITAMLAVAKGMGADQKLLNKLKNIQRVADGADEVYLTTRQVMARLGLCKKTVLTMADDMGVVRHGEKLLRYPLSRVLKWEQGWFKRRQVGRHRGRPRKDSQPQELQELQA